MLAIGLVPRVKPAISTEKPSDPNKSQHFLIINLHAFFTQWTCIFIFTTYLPKRGWVDLVLSILPTGLHIHLIHEAVRHTVPFADAEVVNQPGGGEEGEQEEKVGISFSRVGHFDKGQTQARDPTK